MLHLPPPCSTSLIFSVHTYKKKAVKDGRYRRSSLRLTTAAAAAQLTQTSPDWAISQSAPDAKVTLLCALHCIAFSRQILLLLLLCKKKNGNKRSAHDDDDDDDDCYIDFYVFP